MRDLYDVDVEIQQPVTIDAGGRLRVSQLTTLFDDKILNSDNSNVWHHVGSGLNTFANNMNTLSVSAGQYTVRQSNIFTPYFSGKSQLIELTFTNFVFATGVSKKVGYFSSSAVAPYTGSEDGFYIESFNNTYKLVIKNNGTTILSLDWTLWDGYQKIKNYDWSKFTVIVFDFLWLGGTELRLFLKSSDSGFILVHTYRHAGNNQGTFIKSPNQPIRYSLHSTTGAGTLTQVCSQISSEGSISESGEGGAIFNSTPVTTNTVGTIYAIKAIKKQVANRDVGVKIRRFSAISSSATDNGILTLFKDCTLSAPITYVNKGRIQEGTPTNQTITNGTGTAIASIIVSGNGSSGEIAENFLTLLQHKIDDSMSEYVLGYMPLTSNQTIATTINFITYN